MNSKSLKLVFIGFSIALLVASFVLFFALSGELPLQRWLKGSRPSGPHWGEAGMISVSVGEVKISKRKRLDLAPSTQKAISRSSAPIDFEMGFDAIDAEASFTLAQGAQFRMSGAFSVFFTKADPQNLESAPLIVVDQGKPEVMFLGAAGSSVLFSIRGERLSLAALQESQARRVFRVRNQAQQPSSNEGLEAKNAKPSAASHSSFMGDLDVYRILERQAPQFERCYRVLIQKLPEFRGIATLSFYLGETGEVRDIMVRESFLEESFRRCLEEVVRRTRLPRLPSREPIQIIFPISFE